MKQQELGSALITLFRNSYAYWRQHGTWEFFRRIGAEFDARAKRESMATQASAIEQTSNIAQSVVAFMLPAPSARDVAQIIAARFEALTPLPTYLSAPLHHKRVSVITDSISSGSLFGGVGTALIFSALLANRLGANLRIVTRTERPRPENVDHVLSVYGVELQGEIEFSFLPPGDSKQSLDFSADELFITTSWWTTAAALASVPAGSIVYLLQEDERMFYPFGDERLRCEAILRNDSIRFVVNSRLLFDHLVADGFSNIQERGLWFEPSFPAKVFHPRRREPGDKRKFLFYARPNNLRNLFYLGIEVIEAAIARQILDPDEWEIILVGRDIPDLVFEGGHAPTKYENMSWSAYADLAGAVDLGMSLMYTPHSSYPPLDLVASGAVVVTNSFANKQDLSRYCANLLCVEPQREALLCALRQGVALAMNPQVREQNFQNRGLCADWNESFASVIAQLSGNG